MACAWGHSFPLAAFMKVFCVCVCLCGGESEREAGRDNKKVKYVCMLNS